MSGAPEDLVREAWPRVVARVRDRAESFFDDIIARGSGAGIDWNVIELGTMSLREKDVKGMPLADMYLEFRHREKTYKVHLDDTQKSNEGWHLVYLSMYDLPTK